MNVNLCAGGKDERCGNTSGSSGRLGNGRQGRELLFADRLGGQQGDNRQSVGQRADLGDFREFGGGTGLQEGGLRTGGGKRVVDDPGPRVDSCPFQIFLQSLGLQYRSGLGQGDEQYLGLGRILNRVSNAGMPTMLPAFSSTTSRGSTAILPDMAAMAAVSRPRTACASGSSPTLGGRTPLMTTKPPVIPICLSSRKVRSISVSEEVCARATSTRRVRAGSVSVCTALA